ncbi:hypothetical protein GOD44_23455 [Sinorhizobium medicae]|nr:hypothetical protein [Sinorhizobium medicae]
MNPVISPKDFFEQSSVIDSYRGLTCWMLYSDTHRKLSNYIRENWNAIDAMSGYRCLLCLLDQPTKWEDPYWKHAKIKPHLGDLLKSRPFDRNESFTIADSLGVPYADMPAFVFFPSVHSSTKVLVKIDNISNDDELTSVFSKTMDCVRTVVQNSRFNEISDQAELVQERENCLHRLEPMINRQRFSSVVYKIVSPTTILAAVEVAAGLYIGK